MECSTEILLYFKQQGKEIKDKIMFYTTFCFEKFLKFLKDNFFVIEIFENLHFLIWFSIRTSNMDTTFSTTKKRKKVVKSNKEIKKG